MKRRSRFFVVEARRLIPLVFLLLLLVSLTVYDNFFRVEPVVAPPDPEGNGISFTTTEWGALSVPKEFKLAGSYDEWSRVAYELGVEVPDYPFNAEEEVALFTVNSRVEKMDVIPKLGEVEVRVQVEPEENFFHVVTVDRNAIDHQDAVWKFVGEEGQIFSRIVPPWSEKEGEREEEELNGEEGEEEVVK